MQPNKPNLLEALIPGSERVHLSPELQVRYPNALKAIYLVECQAHNIRWRQAVEKVAKEHGIDAAIIMLRNGCDLGIKRNLFDDPVYFMLARDEFSTDDFKKYLTEKLNLV